MIKNAKCKMQNAKKRSFKSIGFTLLELLVVISIISILVALGAASYSTAQKKGRDAKRKGDLRAVSAAMEQYYSVCGNVYPTTFMNVVCNSPTLAVMPTGSFPQEPKGTPYYCSGCGASTYRLCTDDMEAEPTTYCINSQQ